MPVKLILCMTCIAITKKYLIRKRKELPLMYLDVELFMHGRPLYHIDLPRQSVHLNRKTILFYIPNLTKPSPIIPTVTCV